MEELQGVENLEMALRVYGHQSSIAHAEQYCDDTKLEVSFRRNNNDLISKTLSKIVPKGTTPIARSLEKAAGDFPECDNCRNVIILITDGIEACDEDPCAVSRALQKKGIVLKPFVIGVGLEGNYENLACVGNFYDATSEESFESILNIVISQALNNTTAQINLLDQNAKPLESDVTINIFNSLTENLEYSFVHTLNHRGNPDTLSLDPLLEYNIQVHTLPNIEKKNVTLTAGIHNIIAIDAAQGFLDLKLDGRPNQPIQAIIRHANELKTLHVQTFNSKEKYLTGEYDLEVLTTPRIFIRGVNIAQSHTTTINIPQAGILNLNLTTSGYGSISQLNGSKLNWVLNLDPNINQMQFLLQPGDYQLVFRSKNSKESLYTQKREFTIKSGSSTSLKL